MEYFYDEIYTPYFELPENIDKADAVSVLKTYLDTFNPEDDKDTWFARIKEMCEPLGFTPNVKEYKKNPDAFKGHVGDVSTIIRLATTGRTNTPDLHAILAILGEDTVKARINDAITALGGI